MEAPMISEWETALRIALAILLCGALGWERERLGQVAGMRTHILVGTGAALFTILSAYAFTDWVWVDRRVPVFQIDPSRVAAQIVAGIGFLGAGAIITQGVNVRGLTTAATLWIAAAIGMAVGIGFYFAAALTTVLIIVVLLGVRVARVRWMQPLQSNIVSMEIRAKKEQRLAELLVSLASDGASLQRIDPVRKRRYRIVIQIPGETSIEEIRRTISNHRGVRLRGLSASRREIPNGG
jgi:putative Mg2+ transporter-C (MgtC) family protein